MRSMPVHKYKPYPCVDLPRRAWPSNTITSPPTWCSVDLRDGNQALTNPMSVQEKLEVYRLLLKMGFREIEVGFPSASQADFDFVRLLLEESLIPEGVTIQVLTPAREHLIVKTFQAIKGARRAIVHLYNSTSELQRRVVFRKEKAAIIRLAEEGARVILREARRAGVPEIVYEYSPESFTGTQLDFAVEVCEAVAGVWQPTPRSRMILNLPATVEMSTPNVFADQIEWFLQHLECRASVVLSVHPHNDRGTAVAAAELALMAGAERVEGTLFGNGERTGNVDIITLALNMVSQGVDPNLDIHDIRGIVEVFERCMKTPVHMRHPYAGDLVYTAFSGSHQDAISKGMKVYEKTEKQYWEVPYLPIDPSDVGRSYESIIRINSQSGKGGVAFVMEREYGIVLPKQMHPEFAEIIQRISDAEGTEIGPATIRKAFEEEYLFEGGAILLKCCTTGDEGAGCAAPESMIDAIIVVNGRERTIHGRGNGPIDAFIKAIRSAGLDAGIMDYSEHALTTGSDAKAAAYVQVGSDRGEVRWGVGIDNSIHVASFKAILCALNRVAKARQAQEELRASGAEGD